MYKLTTGGKSNCFYMTTAGDQFDSLQGVTLCYIFSCFQLSLDIQYAEFHNR